jgi:hypothetical protein
MGNRLLILAFFIGLMLSGCTPKGGQPAVTATKEPHGWPNTETLKTRVGEFEFKIGDVFL